MPYKHGTYGIIDESQVADAKQAETACAYIGTAPINLVRGYTDMDLVNMPIKLTDMTDVQSKMGYSKDWTNFTLCECFAEHFDNSVENVGPIYVVNVLDPDTHKGEDVTVTLEFNKRRAEFESSDIILDTLAISGMTENEDYSLTYNYDKGTVFIKLLDPNDTTESAEATYSTVDASQIDSIDIIGEETEYGEFTGLFAFKLMYQYCDAVLSVLGAPGWSEIPEVYTAMCDIVQKLNGHWDGFVNADIPLVDGDGNAVDTIEKAVEWAANNGYDSEFSKIYWPQVIDADNRIFHLSTVGQKTMLGTDLAHNSIPYESPSNKEVMMTAQYFGADSKNKGFDQDTANTLNASGITTCAYWGARWVLWGPHTAAYRYDGDMDARAIFDVNIRMLMYITNSFQIDHGPEIDSPMTPQDRDVVLNAEKERLDTLCGIGALIGTPTVSFLESDNSTTDMMNGDFVWRITVTNTPPRKSQTARVCYTDAGFASFFE